jgi:hypothetical protein
MTPTVPQGCPTITIDPAGCQRLLLNQGNSEVRSSCTASQATAGALYTREAA